MSDKPNRNRREFIAATASAGLLGALAGCEALEPITDDGTGVGGNGNGGMGGNGGSGGNRGEERSIQYGETIQSQLTGNSGREPVAGDLAQPVTFQGSDGDTVTIAMDSDPIDPYLLLQAPDGSIVAENDDGGSGYNSRMTVTLTQSGRYTIWASSYGGNETGEYTLSLERGQ